MTGRFGRTLGIIAVLAFVWATWWIWPESPLRRESFPGNESSNALFLGDGQFVLLRPVSSLKWSSQDPYRVIRLADCCSVIPDHELKDAQIHWDPTHSQLWITRPDQKPRLVHFHSDGTQTIHELAAAAYCTPRWSLDGRVIAVTASRDRNCIDVYDSRTGKVTNSTIDTLVDHHQLSPDGSVLTATSSADETVILVYDVALGREIGRLSMPEGYPVIELAFADSGRRLVAKCQRRQDDRSLLRVFALPECKSLGDIQLGYQRFSAEFDVGQLGRYLVVQADDENPRRYWDIGGTTIRKLDKASNGEEPLLEFHCNGIRLDLDWNSMNENWERWGAVSLTSLQQRQSPTNDLSLIMFDGHWLASCEFAGNEWINDWSKTLIGRPILPVARTHIIDMKRGKVVRSIFTSGLSWHARPESRELWVQKGEHQSDFTTKYHFEVWRRAATTLVAVGGNMLGRDICIEEPLVN